MKLLLIEAALFGLLCLHALRQGIPKLSRLEILFAAHDVDALLCFNFMILNKDRLLGFFSAEKSDAFFPI